MGKTFSTGLLTDGISQDSSNNIGIGVAPSGTNKFEVSGSTKLNGNTAITGSLTVSSSANAIILPAGQTIGLGSAQIYTGTGGNSGNIFIQGAQTKLYADKVVLEAATSAGVEVIGGTKLSGSFIVSGSATTIGATTLSGSLSVSGSITSTSTITAQTLVVQTITSSIVYSSGSNVFGNSLANTQVMTGSVGITGSLTLNNILIPTSASLASTYLQLTGGTLTGALGGTSATFSGNINITSLTGNSAFIKLNRTSTAVSSNILFSTNGTDDWFMGTNALGTNLTDFYLYRYGVGTAFSLSASTGAATFSSRVNVNNATDDADIAMVVKAPSGSNKWILFGRDASDVATFKVSSAGAATFSSTVTATGGYYYGQTTNSFVRLDNSIGSQIAYINTSVIIDSEGVKLSTAGSERMRITSGGNVAIGNTTAAKPLSVWSSGGIGVYSTDTYSPSISIDFNSGTNIGHLLADQNAYYIRTLTSYPIYVMANQNNGVYLSVGSTSWTANSDERLKNINSNIKSAIDKLLTLRAVNFSWKSDDTNKENLGLIAQDVEQVFPQIIDKIKMPSKVGEEQTDETEYLGVRYTELIPVLVKAIQELSAKNESLQSQINELKNN
jgi:hypothetical protein